MKLQRIKRVQRLIPDTRTKPKTVLSEIMRSNYVLQKEIIETIHKALAKLNPKDPQIKFWYKEASEAQTRAIDCAHKLAPYDHAKLANIEIKQSIEHRMVIRSPQKVKSVEEWAKITGASEAKLDEMSKKEIKFSTPAESIHDYDDDEDEINTQRQLN